MIRYGLLHRSILKPIMKKIILLIGSILLTMTFLCGQTKPKSKGKQTEAMPTQKEMEAMMKEAQQELDKLDPEAKHMMDSMGIKMPSMNTIPQLTDAQWQKAHEDENRIVPEKNISRIASLPKTPLTNASMPAFLSTAHSKVIAQLKSASKIKGEEIYQSIKAQHNSAIASGNTAVALWMLGKTELALYVMGKACQDHPVNTDNLNNYACMLSMSGGEHLSLPLLSFVNKKFPGNSTVLNNIGQAWFGLGDIDKADIYLDSTIRIYAYHPQANLTKSFIEESKDHKAAAIEAVKRSIKKSYSQEKENRLKKLGYKLKSADLNWDRPMPQDPLGLEKFKAPDYPKSVTESRALEMEWDVFKQNCQVEIDALRSQQKNLEDAMLAATQRRTKEIIQASQKGLGANVVPPFAPKAIVKLKYLIDGKDGSLAVAYQKKVDAVVKAKTQVATFEATLSAQLEVLEKKYEDEFGEGKSNPFDAACKDENAVKDAFLRSSNGLLQETSNDYLNFLRRKLNDEVYYDQYTLWPEDFEVAKGNAKIAWLTSIQGMKPVFRNKSAWCQAAKPLADKPFKLAAFDDVHCEYHSQLITPVGTIRTDCSRMTTTLDLKFIKLGLKQDMDKETFGDQFMTCSVEVGAGASAGVNAGPLKAEAAIGAAIAAEFDRNGLTDVIIKTSAGMSAGTDIITDGSKAGVGVSDLALEVGVKGQVSIISGTSSIGGTGLLEGLK
jgi:hypothetical protein